MTDFDRVAEYRSAARVILRDDWLEDTARQEALIELCRRGRDEADAELILRAILAELCWSIDRPDVIAERSGYERLERRHQSLRAAGMESCQNCLRPLTNEADWRRWQQLREAAVIEAEVREGAVR
jgi:hypothetical protein